MVAGVIGVVEEINLCRTAIRLKEAFESEWIANPWAQNSFGNTQPGR